MGIASIVLGIVSLVAMLLGIFLAWAPFAGAAFSFGAFLSALAGLVTGGIALSRARQEGDGTGIPIAGLVVNGLAALPALFFALTCGLCNACLSAGVVQNGVHVETFSDGGVVHRRVFAGFGDGDAGTTSIPMPRGPEPSPSPPSDEPLGVAPPGSPPPAFPPPPPEAKPEAKEE